MRSESFINSVWGNSGRCGRAMPDQKSCYGIGHDMKEWSVENESSFTKINRVVVEGFFMGRRHI